MINCRTLIEPSPYGYKGCLAVPLVEIFSVTVHGNSNKKYRVYGCITVTIKQYVTVTIYDREKSDAEVIVSGGTLLLEDPLDDEDILVMPSDDVSVNFNLYYTDANCDKLFAQGHISLNIPTPTDQGCSSEYHESFLQGDENDLKAKLQYAFFPHAITASIDVIFFSKDDHLDYLDDDNMDIFDQHPISYYEKQSGSGYTTRLYGTVSASVVFKGSVGETSNCSMPLLSSRTEDHDEVKSREYICLPRSVVAVPPYSTLEVNFSLSDCDSPLIVSGIAKFIPSCNAAYKSDFVRDDGARIRVRVYWSDACEQLDIINSWKSSNLASLDSRNKITATTKRQMLSLGQYSSAITTDDRYEYEHDCSEQRYEHEHDCPEPYVENCILPRKGVPLTEVFSVVVCSKDRRPFKLYGSVSVRHFGFTDCVYNIDKSSPQICPESGVLAILKGPLALEGPFGSYGKSGEIAIFLDFCDATTGSIISRGFVGFEGLFIYASKSRYMCSVVQGDFGFGLVYFETMSDGVSANVDVKLNSTHGGTHNPCNVKGKIYARHGNYQPAIRHRGNLFKSLLFNDGGDDGLPFDASGSSLPLLKSIVSLPRDSYLIVELDLLIAGLPPERTTSFKDDLRFYSNDDCMRKIAIGEFQLEVSVNFTRAL